MAAVTVDWVPLQPHRQIKHKTDVGMTSERADRPETAWCTNSDEQISVTSKYTNNYCRCLLVITVVASVTPSYSPTRIRTLFVVRHSVPPDNALVEEWCLLGCYAVWLL
jgi:hypothetical protein